jgi:hypothetical protein
MDTAHAVALHNDGLAILDDGDGDAGDIEFMAHPLDEGVQVWWRRGGLSGQGQPKEERSWRGAGLLTDWVWYPQSTARATGGPPRRTAGCFRP